MYIASVEASIFSLCTKMRAINKEELQKLDVDYVCCLVSAGWSGTRGSRSIRGRSIRGAGKKIVSFPSASPYMLSPGVCPYMLSTGVCRPRRPPPPEIEIGCFCWAIRTSEFQLGCERCVLGVSYSPAKLRGVPPGVFLGDDLTGLAGRKERID